MKKTHQLLRNIYHSIFDGIAFAFAKLTRVNNKRILFTSYAHTKYSCNPRYISEYLDKTHHGEYELIWCFKKNISIPDLPKSTKVVRWRSFMYFFYLATAKFIISNVRLGKQGLHLYKKKGQKYIMTWHSSMGVKKIEKDANMETEYKKIAKSDSKMCDLILSGCKFRTNIIKNSFWYNGEILEKGTPRNDVLFYEYNDLKEKIYTRYSIPKSNKILLYAPTFRDNYQLEYYKLNWTDVIRILKLKYDNNYTVLIRLHPTFLSYKHSFHLPNCKENILDVTDYEDMQELLCISDILVTDYSSSIFDFAILKRPVFIFAADYHTYNRGTYLDLEKLPFPFAITNSELLENIARFDSAEYIKQLKKFNNDVIGTFEEGRASKAFREWMIGN